MDYSDQLLAEKEKIFLDSIFEILLGCSDNELSQFKRVFNYYLIQFSDDARADRAEWKVDKIMMAREMADQLETNKSAITLSFHLVKDFYPEKVMGNQDIEKIQNIFARLLIALQASILLKDWVKIKYPSYPLIPALELSIWIDDDEVLEKLKSQVKDFKVSKRAKEFLGYIKIANKEKSKKDSLIKKGIKKDLSIRGSKGGKKSSRLKGVLTAIKNVLKKNKNLSAEQIWMKFAKHKSVDDPMRIGSEYELYIEGDRLWQMDQKTCKERSIKRKSFDRYVAEVKIPT